MSSILTGSITASAFSDWFQHIATRTRGWWVRFLHCLAVAQITISSVKLCLSSSEVLCFHAVWQDPPSITYCILCFQKSFIFY